MGDGGAGRGARVGVCCVQGQGGCVPVAQPQERSVTADTRRGVWLFHTPHKSCNVSKAVDCLCRDTGTVQSPHSWPP